MGVLTYRHQDGCWSEISQKDGIYHGLLERKRFFLVFHALLTAHTQSFQI